MTKQTKLLRFLAVPLAAAGVAIFPIATYDTDYVLLRETALAPAITALRAAGHVVDDEGDRATKMTSPLRWPDSLANR